MYQRTRQERAKCPLSIKSNLHLGNQHDNEVLSSLPSLSPPVYRSQAVVSGTGAPPEYSVNTYLDGGGVDTVDGVAERGPLSDPPFGHDFT